MMQNKNIQSGALFIALAAMMLHWFIPHHEHVHHNDRYVHIVNVLAEGATSDTMEHDSACHEANHHKHNKHAGNKVQSCHDSYLYLLVQGLQLSPSPFQLIQPLWNFLLDLGIGLAPPSAHIHPVPFLNYDRENTVYSISYSVVYLVKSLGLRAPNGRLNVSVL